MLQVTIEWVKKSGQYRKYRYFMFLNSSVRGPFVPSYMPTSWQWHQSFTERLRGDIAGVSSSLVCLPDIDAGGPGPKMESWAFALTKEGDFCTRYLKRFKLSLDQYPPQTTFVNLTAFIGTEQTCPELA